MLTALVQLRQGKRSVAQASAGDSSFPHHLLHGHHGFIKGTKTLLMKGQGKNIGCRQTRQQPSSAVLGFITCPGNWCQEMRPDRMQQTT